MNKIEQIELLLHDVRRENAALRRGQDKEYNIVFYGAGNVAWEGLKSIANSSRSTFDFPIHHISLVGRDERESIERRERLKTEANVLFRNAGSNALVVSKSTESLVDILPETDLFIFTADKNPRGEVNRVNMIQNNIPLIEGIAKYFNKDFKGLINIVANLPEALAHYAASVYDLNDPRQITAHIPLDLMRYAYLIHDKLFECASIKKMDLMVVGYHDHPWPVVDGSLVYRQLGIAEPISEDIKKFQDIAGLVTTLEKFGYNEALRLKSEMQAYQEKNPGKEVIQKEGPTSSTTGSAIREFVRAVINRSNTTTAIPYQYNGRQFFVDLPVSFENGYPILDTERFARLSEEDRYQLGNRIALLEEIVNKSLGKKSQFTVPDSNKILEEIFNPRGNSSVTRAEYMTMSSSPIPLGVFTASIGRKVQIPSDLEIKPQEPKLKGSLYYINNNEPLIIHKADLANPNQNNEKKFKVTIGNDRYDSKISLGKIILHEGKLYVGALYSGKEERKSHLVWFDTSSEKSNGFIKPEGMHEFSIDHRSMALLYVPTSLRDTSAFYQGKIYFLIRNQHKDERAVVFDPNDPSKYSIIGAGVEKDEALMGVLPLKDDLIFAGSRNLYRLHKDRLKKICRVECEPNILRGIPDERLIGYAYSEGDKIYACALDSHRKITQFSEGPYFEIAQYGDILMASILGERVQLTSYNGVPDFTERRIKENNFSKSIAGLSRIMLANENYLLAIAQSEQDMTLHSLSTANLKDFAAPIALKNASYLRCELG